MKSWIIGLIGVCIIIAGGLILSTGFAGNSGASKAGENPVMNTETPSVIPASAELQEPSVDDKISADALKCTIKDSGNHVIDLRLKNPGKETRTITVSPSSTNIDVLPGQIKRIDLYLAEEVSSLTISADDGTQLQTNVPACIESGGSGNGAGVGLSQKNRKNPPEENLNPPEDLAPPAPVPELSPLVLTLVGISGLMLISRIRRN